MGQQIRLKRFRFMSYICSFWEVLNFMRQCYCWSFFCLHQCLQFCIFYLLLIIICDKNSPLKGHVSNFTLCCINDYLTSLLSSTNPIHLIFRYGGEKFLNIWKGLDWYYWLVCLCPFWHCLQPFWWWNAFPKLLWGMKSTMFGELVVVMTISAVLWVSKNSSIVNVSLLLSWCLGGLR